MISVLFVDDEPGLLELTRAYLKKEGDIAVRTAGSAEEALNLLRHESFDVIISDYEMPRMSGIALLKAVKASGNDTPFIIFTGRGREEAVIEALNNGAEFYLQKGGDPKAQFTEMRNVILKTVRRVRTERAHARSLEKYHQLLELIHEGVWALDGSWKTTYVNPKMGSMLGYGDGEMTGRDFFSFMPKNNVETAKKQMAAQREGKEQRAVMEFIRKDGRRIYANVSTKAIEDASGGVEGSLALVLDISEWKRIEDALCSREKDFRNIVIRNVDAMLVLDMDGVIMFSNPAAERLFDIASDDLKGRMFGYPIVLEEPMEILVVRQYSSFVAAEMRIVDVDWSGMPAYLVSLRDVTERKMTEHALRVANKKLNMMSGITRHDVLNQITLGLGYIDLIKDTQPDEDVMEFLAKEEGVLNTIREQINFTRDYQDMGMKAPEWQVLGDVIAKAKRGLQDRGLKVEADVGDFEILADPMLEKVFYNLMDNTSRHSGKKDATIRISAVEKPGSLVIELRDDGAGISDMDRPMLFQRGYGKNTGYGLFLAREILGITGIGIAERGEEGKGARFEIEIPNGDYRHAGSRPT